MTENLNDRKENVKTFLLTSKFPRRGGIKLEFSEDEVQYLFEAYDFQRILNAIAFMSSLPFEKRRNVFCQKSYLINAIRDGLKPGR